MKGQNRTGLSARQNHTGTRNGRSAPAIRRDCASLACYSGVTATLPLATSDVGIAGASLCSTLMVGQGGVEAATPVLEACGRAQCGSAQCNWLAGMSSEMEPSYHSTLYVPPACICRTFASYQLPSMYCADTLSPEANILFIGASDVSDAPE